MKLAIPPVGSNFQPTALVRSFGIANFSDHQIREVGCANILHQEWYEKHMFTIDCPYIYIIFSNREGHIQHRTSDHRNESHLSDHGNRYRCKKTMQPGPAVSSFEKVIFTGRLKWFRTVELRDFSETVEETLRAVVM